MAPNGGTDWWTRLDSTFQAALALPSGERARYLDRACGADTSLRDEVAAMLAADEPQHALGIERRVHDGPEVAPDPDPFIGMRLGPWRVVNLVGHGGMGSVYLAERADGQYEQRVALKVVRGAAAQPTASSRFKSETYILARLSHPNIARVIDAGHTPEGSPYLVMEFVDGSPVTTHCDVQRLTLDRRLSLFRTVCAATQHAHQALVVHRDLKPSNIFVTQSGEVKLLDFGIAKLLEPDHPTAEQTRPEMRALTPAYAAPEQLRGEPVTTAADVYVLGAVLYELLTGERPAAQESIAGGRETSRVPPPSVAIRRRLTVTATGAGDGLAIAAARRTSPERLVRRLAGDIDRVVLKALHQEPDRRYGSAGQFADDLQRLLEGRPVSAQPDTFAYRSRRFVARHRMVVAAAVLLCALVVTSAAVAIWQARAAATERDRSRLEARRAERVSVLVTDLFKLAEPAAGRGDTIAARDLLDQASRRIGMELQGDPETQAALFNALARVYGNLGLHDSAIAVLQRALNVENAAQNRATLARAETLHLLGERHASKNDHVAADSHFRDALALRRELNAPALDIAATLDSFGRMLSLTGKYADARLLMEESVEIRRRQPGAQESDLMSGLYELGVLLHGSGDVERGGAPPSRVGRDRSSNTRAVAREGHRPAASCGSGGPVRPRTREGDAAAPRGAGDGPQHLPGRSSTGRALPGRARTQPVRPRTLDGRRSHDARSRSHGASVVRGSARRNVSRTTEPGGCPSSRTEVGGSGGGPHGCPREFPCASWRRQPHHADHFSHPGDRARRKRPLRRGARAQKGRAGEDDRDARRARRLRGDRHGGLGQHGLKSGRMDLAEHYFVRALEVRRQIHPPDHWRIDEARGMLGFARLRAGRMAAAETDLLSAYEGLTAHRGPTARETALVRTRLVELYDRWKRPADADRYRDRR